MPELPDVAGFKKYLDATSLHQTIDTTHCYDGRFIKETSRRRLQKHLKGARLKGTRRWGKWLFVDLDTGGELVLHFGMTGQLNYGHAEADLPEHTRLELDFENGKRLAVVSQRMIGQAGYTDDVDAFARQHDLGIDALDGRLDADAFIERMQSRRGSLKSALMNQSVLAGIGNVYSDEILYQARLHPASRVKALDRPALRTVHKKVRHVLKTASKWGGDSSCAPRSWLLGHRGADGQCPGCDGQLKSTKINGRTAWFCPNCQAKA